MIDIDRYLGLQGDAWLLSEHDQALAKARDRSLEFNDRDQAYAAAYFLCREIESRKEQYNKESF